MSQITEKKATHTIVSPLLLLKKSFKWILALGIVNLILLGFFGILSFFDANIFAKYSIILGPNLHTFNALFLIEGAILLIGGPGSISVREFSEKKIFDEPDTSINNNSGDSRVSKTFEQSFIHSLLTKEITVTKKNVTSIVGGISGVLLILLSIVIDVLFISNKLI